MIDLLVTGSRDWTNKEAIKQVLGQFCEGEVVTLMHGDCRGADRLSEEALRELEAEGVLEVMDVERYPADWGLYGRAAGPVRNKRMVGMGPDLVLAFHENLKESKGTADCVRKAKAADIRVVVVEEVDDVSSL